MIPRIWSESHFHAQIGKPFSWRTRRPVYLLYSTFLNASMENIDLYYMISHSNISAEEYCNAFHGFPVREDKL